MTEQALNRLLKLSRYLRQNRDNVVIDGDTHPTDLSRLEGAIKKMYDSSDAYYQGRPISPDELLIEMKLARVDMSLTWQNPAALIYSDDQSRNLEKLSRANEDIFNLSEKFPDKFIPAGWTDPKALGLEKALALVEKCVLEWGFPIVKMNPAQNAYPIDSEDVMIVVERIVSLGATPAFHYGGDSPYTPASGLQRIAEMYSEHPIIGVHMGGGGSHYVDGDQLYIDSRKLGLRCPNIFFILSAIRDCHIESALIAYTLAGKPFVNNLACGSDAPYGKQTWNFGGFDRMFGALKDGRQHPDKRLNDHADLFTDETIQGYKGRNLANLIIRSCDSVLVKAKVSARSIL